MSLDRLLVVILVSFLVSTKTFVLAFSPSNRCSLGSLSTYPSTSSTAVTVITVETPISNVARRQNAPSSNITMAITSTTRSRPVKRTSSMRQPPQRSASSDSLTAASMASGLDIDELNIHNTNTNGNYHHTSNNNNNHIDATESTQGSLSGPGGMRGKNSSHGSTHSGSDCGDVEAPQSVPMHRSSSLVPMEIRASAAETSGGTFDDDNDFGGGIGNRINRKSFLPRRLRSWSAKQPSWISILDSPSLQTGRFLVLGASAIYGTNFATVKLLDDSMPLSISAALRFGLASVVVSAFVFGRENDDVDAMVQKERNLAFWSGAEVGLWYSIGYLAQAEGLQTVAAGKSAFFNSLAVVVVPLLDALVKGKMLRRKEIASVALACLGVGLLEVGPTGLQITPGDILAFMQTIFFGIGYWRLEAVSHAHPHQAARVTVGQLTAVAGGATLYALTEFGLGHMDCSIDLFAGWLGDPFILGALFWTGLVSTALALYLETVALKVVSATELTLLMTTTSLWGASFAYLTIGEVLSPTGMVGGLMILAGCGLSAAAPLIKEKAQIPSSDRIATL